MREIKFRAWMEEDKKMFYFPWYFGSAHGNTKGNPEKMDRPIMQYTGLKDKNGVEIYEGDIVQWEKSGDTWGEKPYITKREVKFKDGAFLTHTEFSVNENYLPIIATWGEVIGNIYESPDLLNKGSE